MKAVDELSLLICGTRAHREASADRMAALARAVDADELLHTLERQQILGLARHRLRQLGASPDGFLGRAAEAQIADRHRSAAFATATSLVLDTLGSHSLRALPLKGVTLSRWIYDDRAIRRSKDIDVLVDAAALPAAVAALRELGYGESLDQVRRGNLPELHYQLPHRTGILPPVELHWRIHWFEEEFSAAMLGRASPSPGEGHLRAQPSDELAALLLFFARDGFVGLRLLADVAAWWDAVGERGTTPSLEPLAERHPTLAPAWDAALAVAGTLAGVPRTALLPPLRSARRIQMATRLANWDLSGDIDQIYANITLVDGLLTPRGQLRDYARRHLLIRSDVLDDYYALAPGPSLRRAAMHVLHPPKMLLRYALAAVRVRLRGRWSAVPLSVVR